MARSEPHQTSQPDHLGITSDICSVRGVYLTDQEELISKDNFPEFYTQRRSISNLIHTKIYPDQEDMDFTNRRFSSPSICEYPSLEGDLSPTKSRPEPKPISEVNRSILALQQAHNEEKWPRRYEVMVQFPKPVKPVLHLPDLESHRFNQLQTKYWRPGDQSIHSGVSSNGPGEVKEFLPCTRAHLIRRILLFENLPNMDASTLRRISDQRPSHQSCCVLDAFLACLRALKCTSTQKNTRILEETIQPNQSRLWKDLAIFRFILIQANQLRPEDNQPRPRLQEDKHNHIKGVSISLQWTSNHRNKKIYIWSHLPYLELLAIKLQQLFSHQLVHDLSSFKSIKKVPKMLSYPLKPSRFKIIQAPTFKSRMQQSLQRLVSDFMFLLICFLYFLIMNVALRIKSII